MSLGIRRDANNRPAVFFGKKVRREGQHYDERGDAPCDAYRKWILLKQGDSAFGRRVASKKADSEGRTQAQGDGYQINAVAGHFVPSHTEQNETHEEKKCQRAENRANYHNPRLSQSCRLRRDGRLRRHVDGHVEDESLNDDPFRESSDEPIKVFAVRGARQLSIPKLLTLPSIQAT